MQSRKIVRTFRWRKLAKSVPSAFVFAQNAARRAKAKTQAAKVLRKELVKEEPIRTGTPAVQQLFTCERITLSQQLIFHSSFLKAFATSVSHLP